METEIILPALLESIDFDYFSDKIANIHFEWAGGYSQKFGLHYVDFNDPNRSRTVKDSAKYISQLIADNGFVNSATSIKNSMFVAGITIYMAVWSFMSRM